MAKKDVHSAFSYPCGHLVSSNYPDAMRDVSRTDTFGVDLPHEEVDLAAIDLFRDRERGIQFYNEFRRQLSLKPFKTWEAMTGDKKMTKEEIAAFVAGEEGTKLTKAKKLELIYGEAPEGIENCDLLVGDLYEEKLRGFAISETSFMIFLLMASRRLDADPYLNEYLDEDHYTTFGLKHVEEVDSLRTILKRHYPEIEATFPAGQSVFKPTYGPEKWVEKENLYQSHVKNWEATQKENNDFFREMITGK